MQSLEYRTSGTQTISLWPDVTSSLASNPSASFQMTLDSDYGRQTTNVNLTLINTPTSILPRLVFQLNRSELPSYSGNYTITIKEQLAQNAIWGQINILFSDYDQKWSSATFGGGTETTLDTDRAWVSGSDFPSYQQYTSPNETGAYTIYHG